MNNQTIKTNNQVFKITDLRIRPRLTDVHSKILFHYQGIVFQNLQNDDIIKFDCFCQ